MRIDTGIEAEPCCWARCEHLAPVYVCCCTSPGRCFPVGHHARRVTARFPRYRFGIVAGCRGASLPSRIQTGGGVGDPCVAAGVSPAEDHDGLRGRRPLLWVADPTALEGS